MNSIADFLSSSPHDILATIDALATHGVLTERKQPVRVLPGCSSQITSWRMLIGPTKLDTGFVDEIFEAFGATSFRILMRNLAELDWRLDLAGYEYGLLDRVWQTIFNRFRSAEAAGQGRVLDDLATAAIYQPSKILELVRVAMNRPVTPRDDTRLRRPRTTDRDHVIRAVPQLLGATAHHWAYISDSVDILWELAIEECGPRVYKSGAGDVLKGLASYRLYKSAAFNSRCYFSA